MSKVKSYYGGSTSHYYTYNGSTLVQEKIVTSGSQTTEYLTFLYNSEGPTGFVYNNTLYTYRKNIFGDIIAVYNGTSKVAEYAYDAYGNCRVITGSNIGTLNPFRYRGYYFDEDMKLYYLQSRYYDPETGRFINADDVSYLDPETIHGLNLYTYCLNNPVMYVDPSGHIAVSSVVIGLIIGVAIGLGAALYIDYSDDGQVFNGSVEWYDYLFAGTIGGLLGAFIGYLFPAISGFLNATFTFSLPTLGTVSGGGSLALVSGTTISITGAQVLTLVGLGTIMFSKGFGPRMGHNQYERKMWDEAMQRIGVKDKRVRRILHDQIHNYEYKDNLKDLIELLKFIIKKLGIKIK